MNLNSITVVGRLVRNPEMKKSKAGTDYCQITVAVEHETKGFNGSEGKKEVCFIGATLFGKEAMLAAQLTKGAEIFLDGRLKMDKWTDKTGAERTGYNIAVSTIIHNFKLDDQVHTEEATTYQPIAKPPVKKPQQDPNYEDFEGMPF